MRDDEGSAETSGKPRSSEAASPSAPAAGKRGSLRFWLLLAGPVVAVGVALFVYLTTGGVVSEEDSYIGAPNVTITTQVAGQVSSVGVVEGQSVEAGALLFSVDPEPYRIALDQAAAQLAMAREQLDGLVLTYRQNLATVKQQEANVAFVQAEADRADSLLASGTGTRETADSAKRDLRVAQDQLAQAEAAASATLAQLGGSADMPVERQSSYLVAKADLDKAERNLRLAAVTAPFAGTVTQVDNIQPGTYLAAGQAAFTLVSNEAWVDANIKETDLVRMTVGDRVSVVVDNYPDRILAGTVETIAPASGSVFSLLPPQNASGNWVKVVQRIPVRVKLDEPPADMVLRVGSSATVSIDTGYRRSLSTLLPDLGSIVGL